MKPVDVYPSMHIDFIKENNKENLKSKVGDNVRISKYKNIFAKAVFQIGLKKFLGLKNLKTLCHGHMLLMILMEKKLLEPFTKKELQKTNQKEFRVQKAIKRKDYKLYVKWKGYNNSFNNWIKKKDKKR